MAATITAFASTRAERTGAASSNLETVLVERHPEAIGGKLNPEWVEWLMGFPQGHTLTGSKPSGTP